MTLLILVAINVAIINLKYNDAYRHTFSANIQNTILFRLLWMYLNIAWMLWMTMILNFNNMFPYILFHYLWGVHFSILLIWFLFRLWCWMLGRFILLLTISYDVYTFRKYLIFFHIIYKYIFRNNTFLKLQTKY